jgi:hypothetical protein
VATALFKIANDIRWLASGPRSGIGELIIPENEPGSSIMPGKVNPTQCEALTRCARRCSATMSRSACGCGGNWAHVQPLIAYSMLQSTRLLGDACRSFDEHCAQGLEPNRAEIDRKLHGSLMLVTALAPHIGYDKAAQIAKHAHARGTLLRDAAIELGFVTGRAVRQSGSGPSRWARSPRDTRTSLVSCVSLRRRQQEEPATATDLRSQAMSYHSQERGHPSTHIGLSDRSDGLRGGLAGCRRDQSSGRARLTLGGKRFAQIHTARTETRIGQRRSGIGRGVVSARRWQRRRLRQRDRARRQDLVTSVPGIARSARRAASAGSSR